MAPRKKTDTGAAPKKRARTSTTRKKTTTAKTTRTTKARTIAEPLPTTEVEEQPIQDAVVPPLPQLPSHMMVDGRPVPIRGVMPPEPALPPPIPPAPPVVKEVAPPPPPSPPPVSLADERERARMERLQRRQRDRQNGNAAAQTPVTPPPVVTAPAAPVVPQVEPQQEAPNTQQLTDRAIQTIKKTPPEAPTTNPVHLPVPQRTSEHDDIKVGIPELYQYKIQVHETRMRELAAPIRTQLKAQAEEWLRNAIVSTLAQNPEYQEACRETENCVNELLEQLHPQLPEGYAVVMIGAKEGQAVCRYAPEQAGKRFKID